MANQWQNLFENIKQILPRRTPTRDREVESPSIVLTEAEAKVVEQTAKTEKDRWQQIVELGVPTGMLVIGGLLAGFAELIGVWGVFGFLLVTGAPIVYWQQRLEKRIKEMTDEVKKLRTVRR